MSLITSSIHTWLVLFEIKKKITSSSTYSLSGTCVLTTFVSNLILKDFKINAQIVSDKNDLIFLSDICPHPLNTLESQVVAN